MFGKGIAEGMGSIVGPQTVRNFNPIAVTVADQDFTLSGVTRDSVGSPLGNCVVDLFITSTDAITSTTVSDATGIFRFYVQPLVTYYLVAYKAGSPDVAGTTVNTLVGI